MIVQLPTRSPRRYRGQYPGRINAWSYSRSAPQMILAKHLGMSRPVHIEDNSGYRYVADMSVLNPEIKLGMELADAVVGFNLEDIADLSQDRYDAMLAEMDNFREKYRKHGNMMA
jgi:hypothetical protein